MQTWVRERLHVISTHTKFEEVLTNTSIFRAYNVHLLFSENFENFFPTFGRNGPVVPKRADFVQNQIYQEIHKTEIGKVIKFQKATPNGLGVIRNNPLGGISPRSR